MAKKKKAEIEIDNVVDDVGPLFSFDDDEDIEPRVEIEGHNKSVMAQAFSLPIDTCDLSDVLSKEASGEISIRDKQVIPCPKEGVIMVYVEYEINW